MTHYIPNTTAFQFQYLYQTWDRGLSFYAYKSKSYLFECFLTLYFVKIISYLMDCNVLSLLIYMCICVRVFVCMCACMCLCIGVCVYACNFVCVCVCVVCVCVYVCVFNSLVACWSPSHSFPLQCELRAHYY